MSLFGGKHNNSEPQSFPLSLVETGASTSEEHQGAMASPHYCNDLDCWCHTNVAYHDAVTSLPADTVGDKAFQAFSQFLDSDGEFLSDAADGSYTTRRW